MRINLKKSTADKIKLNLRMSQGKKTEILFDLKRAEAYFDRNNSMAGVKESQDVH